MKIVTDPYLALASIKPTPPDIGFLACVVEIEKPSPKKLKMASSSQSNLKPGASSLSFLDQRVHDFDISRDLVTKRFQGQDLE